MRYLRSAALCAAASSLVAAPLALAKAKPGNYEQGATKAARLANDRVSAQLSAMK